MAPSRQLFRDFQTIGSPVAWIVAALVVAIAFAYGGWTPWLTRFMHLIATYALMHLALSAIRRFGGDLPPALAVGLLPSLAVVAALITTSVYRAINESAHLVNGSVSFDVGISMGFALAITGWAVIQSEVENRREERHTLALESEAQERQLAELRLGLLQAQIEPHFIYNTLANVQQLVRTSPADADRMLDSLIRYLKESIPEVRSGRSTIGQELARAQAYLTIMGMRMGERLRYEIDVASDLHPLPIPPLALMTLVENAVRHGVDAKREGGLVRIEGKRAGTSLRLSVIDDGAGFSEEVGDGIGLSNLRARIASLHGSHGALELSHRAPRGVEATLLLPVG